MPRSKYFTTIFTYPWDLQDEGPEQALDIIQTEAGIDGVSLAVAYHIGTFFLPHNPKRKIFFGEDGVVLFVPHEKHWNKTRIRPRIGQAVKSREWTQELAAAIKKRGLHFTAWTVYFYNHYLARTYPQCAHHDALGNAHLAHLCPANPEIQQYALALTEDIAVNLKPDAFYLESLCFLPFGYGYLGTKFLTPLTPRAQFLLGLCFCEHCLKASDMGIDAARFKAEVARWLERELPKMPRPTDQTPVDDDWRHTAFDNRLQHYLAARARIATLLYEEVVKRIKASNVRPSRSGRGVGGEGLLVESDYATPEELQISGLIPERVNPITDRLGLGVPARKEQVKPKRHGLGKAQQLLANIEPEHVTTEAAIVKPLTDAVRTGADGFTFYNYGLLRREQLRWIGAACRKVLLGLLVPFSLFIMSADAAAKEPPYGIDKRVPWTSSHVVGSPDPPPPYQIKRAFPRLKFAEPLYLVPEPGSDRLFLVERYGKIRVFADNPDADQAPVILELKDRETYSLAFHPDYVHNGFLYLFSNHDKLKPQRNVVSRFETRHTPFPTCSPASERPIVSWESSGHDGGCVAFGPDGYLYVSTGDGTSGSDPKETGQDLRDLLAAVLRVDVNRASADKPYSIPPDNPFVQLTGARPEIWAYGLRNPWRFSFDPDNGNLWFGDVGQDLWEMIYLVRRGGNYGWSVQEGSHPFQPRRRRGPTPILPPIVEHPHSEFRSIIGGFVYHGAAFAELNGAYIYGDHETGKIWGLRYDGKKVTWQKELAQTPLKIVAFGEDHRHELYVVPLSGELYRLKRTSETRANPRFPKRLSETGLFASVPKHEPAAGLIPYSVNSPLWSDNASKERFLALPGNSQVGVPNRAEEAWDLPEGTVLVKTFSLDMEEENPASRRRIETRLLTRQSGHWRGFTYLWNAEQIDAELVAEGGRDVTYTIRDRHTDGRRSQTWHYPSRAECMVCHTRAAGFVLGLNTLQMNRTHDYGSVSDNQLRTLEHAGVFRNPLPRPPDQMPRLPNPDDEKETIEARARSYLHANCAHCHVTDGGGNARMEMRFTTPRKQMQVVGVPPQHETYDIAEALLISPGHPERSIIHRRLEMLGPGRMPPLASSVVDEKRLRIIREWINGLRD